MYSCKEYRYIYSVRARVAAEGKVNEPPHGWSRGPPLSQGRVEGHAQVSQWWGSEGRRLLGDRRRLLYCPGDDESSLSSDLASSPSLTSQKVIGWATKNCPHTESCRHGAARRSRPSRGIRWELWALIATTPLLCCSRRPIPLVVVIWCHLTARQIPILPSWLESQALFYSSFPNS